MRDGTSRGDGFPYLVGGIGLLLVGMFVVLIYDTTPRGYDSHFDGVQERLARIDGLEILRTARYEDITLEDFGFAVKAEGGTEAALLFLEGTQDVSLFDHAGGIVLWDSWDTKRTIRLGPGNAVEKDLQREIRDLDDILRHLDHVLPILEDLSQDPSPFPFDSVTDFVHLTYPDQMDEFIDH